MLDGGKGFMTNSSFLFLIPYVVGRDFTCATGRVICAVFLQYTCHAIDPIIITFYTIPRTRDRVIIRAYDLRSPF